MSIDFNVKDILHRIQVRFIHAFLPDAKKPYYLKAVHQPELDIHGIASKAEVYNIGTSPKVIEEGFTAGSVLACYLAADGYRLNTPLFKMKVKVPGEYDGSETHLPQEVYPTVVLQATAQFRKYLREKVKIEFDGIEQADGLIAEAYDEASEMMDELATIGKLLTIHGFGLKIEADDTHKNAVGLFFDSVIGYPPVKADIIAVNQPRTLKVIVPAGLKEGSPYKLRVVTQGSARTSAHLLKELRQSVSDFSLTAQLST